MIKHLQMSVLPDENSSLPISRVRDKIESDSLLRGMVGQILAFRKIAITVRLMFHLSLQPR